MRRRLQLLWHHPKRVMPTAGLAAIRILRTRAIGVDTLDILETSRNGLPVRLASFASFVNTCLKQVFHQLGLWPFQATKSRTRRPLRTT